MRINRCNSSIHTSLAQLLLFASLFAIFIFFFLYLQPQHQNIVNIFRINRTKIILTANLIEEAEVEEDDYNVNPLYNDFSSPPINVTFEKRISWFKNKLNESKLFKSTPRTRNSHDKIVSFLSQGKGNDTKCNITFFMIWISPIKLFGKRDLLSLESVLKTHPKGCVIILSRIMDSKRGRTMLEPLLRLGHRVSIVAPDFHLLFNNTPAQGWLERLEAGLVDPGEIPITQNLSNLLRLVVLYKYGGVYLDTDVVILNDISNLKNSIGIQTIEPKPMDQTTLNNAVLIFDKQHPMLLKFMEEFNSSFNGNVWGVNGPYLVTRVVLKHVNDPKLEINILPHMAFYPVDWTQIEEYFWKFEEQDDIKWAQEQYNQVVQKSYGVHLWNKISHTMKIENGSIIGRLISSHCIICHDIYSL